MVLFDLPVVFGINLAPVLWVWPLPLEFRTPFSVVSSSWPQHASWQPNLWEYLGSQRNSKAQLPSLMLLVLYSSPSGRVLPSKSVFIPIHSQSDLLQTTIVFSSSLPPNIQRLTIASKASFITRTTKRCSSCTCLPHPYQAFYLSDLWPLLQPHWPSFSLYYQLCSHRLLGLCTCCFLYFLPSSLINSSLPFKSQFKH